MTDLGIYLHLPFCRSICSYCDFYKMRAKTPRIRQYIDYIIKEIDLHVETFRNAQANFQPKTLYIGGGTPSFIPLDDLERLLKRLGQWLNLADLQEFTIEANPEDLNLSFLTLIKKYHVSRLSIGIQSFNPLAHRVLNRVSDYHDVQKKVALLKQLGITNYNLDLMFGIPDMNHDLVKQDLELFLSLEPTHLSCYSLILEERTLLFNQYLKGEFKPLEEDEEAAIYQLIKDTLTRNGFNHYETSNFARPGYESLHNLIYWNNERYLGIGAGSSSYLGNTRLKTVSNLDRYFSLLDQGRIGREEEIQLSKQDQMEEEVMLGLRKTQGISLERFYAKFGEDFFSVFPMAKKLIDQQYLQRENNYLRLNPKYHFTADYVLRKLI
ncbi:MAG TPA: radical SAM family heme chaperone HemW [Bacilli bacterium]|nr:radical SAM family heme chaperone HemW [Bacilli bacterium]HRS30889.1 radical SAM family heme chaperone HemW [Bacilli bacterium]HRU49523.1 radical SAM family heme chaperone HemW [Bacilli bacterium]